MDKKVIDLLDDIVEKVRFLKYLDKAEKSKEGKKHKVYNEEVEQFLKRSCDVTEFKKGKVWNVKFESVVNKDNNKSWIDSLEDSVKQHLKKNS